MSFSQNGSRRYGHVPPAQYGAQYAATDGVRRQSSFDRGDDGAYIPHAPARSMQPLPMRTDTQHDELFMGISAQQPAFAAQASFSNTSPVTSYQQYQPYEPAQPSGYNPLQFARANSQSRPTPTPTQYSPQLYQHPQPTTFPQPQPYNPQAYSTQSPQHQTTPTLPTSYGLSPTYTAPGMPQSPTVWSQPASFTSAASPQRHPTTYNPASHAPYLPAASSGPTVPPRPAVYVPQSTMNGSTAADAASYTPYPLENQIPTGNYQPFGDSYGRPHSDSQSSMQSPYYAATTSPTDFPPTAGLQRHPTLRPLPRAPHEDVYEPEGWDGRARSAAEIEQDRMFQDIEAAVMGTARLNTSASEDLLDNELTELRRHDSTATKLHTPNVQRHTSDASGRSRGQDSWDDESDAEAAAGLQAMRIAEDEEGFQRSREGSRASVMSSPQRPLPEPVQEEADSSDDDFGHIDVGTYGGGLDVHMSYGNDHLLAAATLHDDASSRPLPMPQVPESHAAVASHGRSPSFVPPIDTAPSFPPDGHVDTFGTGGPQEPQMHRMSFDDGDDRHMDYRPAASYEPADTGSGYADEFPEIFYHPGMTGGQRPLPVLPMSESRTPQLMPAGTYRSQSQRSQNSFHSSNGSVSTDAGRPYYVTQPEPYGQSMLTPNGQFPRSSSLSSHPSTPQTVPPVRSKTDADERSRRELYRQQQMAMRGAALDSIDSASTQSVIGIDLPVLPDGRRRKFVPDKLSSADFRRCSEPWALSHVAAWLREMAGGDDGDGDLRAKTVKDGLVALFTHKVPTMNTADAETLAARVIDSLFAAGVLIRDEEWVKFGPGVISGVMWQLTGAGCYAPRLHEHEIAGRCYSQHCHRTLKKVNLQTHVLPPSKKSADWADFYKVTREQITSADKKEIQRQNIIHEIVQSEDVYMEQLDVVCVIYRDELRSWQPPIIAPNRLPKFLNQVFGKVEAVKTVNEDYLLAHLKYRQEEQGPWITGVSDIFREWIRKAKQAYVDYAAAFPDAAHLIRKEAERNLFFHQFLTQAQNNKRSNRLDWNTYLKAPITRLQRYSLLLSNVLDNMKVDSDEKINLQMAIDEIRAATFECDAKVAEMQRKVEIDEVSSKLNWRPDLERVELNLNHLGRELLFRGDLQRAGTNRFQWKDTHAILFDHYLVLSKPVFERDATGLKKKEKYDVSKLLLVLESTNDDPVVKSTLKGLPVTTVVRPAQPSPSENQLSKFNSTSSRPPGPEHTSTTSSFGSANSNNKIVTTTNLEGDAKAMYPFRIKHLGRSQVYTLYAPNQANREEWCKKIYEAKTRYAAALFAQNAEPFRLRIVADSAFAYDTVSAAARSTANSLLVKGTPLDRAIRGMEREYGTARPGPVCRAQVNCATSFTGYGKEMVAIGTDFGVFVSEANNPRGWTRTVQMNRVTQITVLEEFSACLIISDKTLIAFHLDTILPASNYPAPHSDSARRAPQKLSSSREVSFFATARMKDRQLVFYKKKDGMSSTFKVLEPVFQKSTEKRSRLFSRKGNSGTTEFFREFDEFYIPTECYGVNLFHSYIAVATARGFELLTLDKKITMSIPDLKQPSISSIAARVGSQKPLGMFRLSDAEFLLCYEECGVYVDRHGDVSRSVIMEFVGKAKSAAMHGTYLVLFDSDFVEIRNAENGRLRQIIAGRDIRCLDAGILPHGQGHASGAASPQTPPSALPAPQRPLKLAMGHPEHASSQLILELLLNDGHKD